MQKALLLGFGLLFLLVGGGGMLLPVWGYVYAREEAILLADLSFPLFPFFYLPFTLWLFVTGGGLLCRRKWAWYSVQTIWVFLLGSGVLALVGFNFLLVSFGISGARVQGIGNLGLALFLIFLPLGGLVLFGRARAEFEPAARDEEEWITPAEIPEYRRPGW